MREMALFLGLLGTIVAVIRIAIVWPRWFITVVVLTLLTAWISACTLQQVKASTCKMNWRGDCSQQLFKE